MHNYLLVLNISYALNGNINGGFVARSQISNVPFFREKHLRLTKTLEQNWLLKYGYVVCPFSTLYFTPFENAQRWMGKNTFHFLILNDDNMIGEH